MDDKLREEINRRRTFAIISHPDAGKTTLTEKFLLFGGAINTAGSVKGKANSKYAVSDWMDIEKERGISVTSSVLQFNYGGYCINILDTPGHQDFSEDTYRTLMAADSAVMVIDASKGVEAQTIKLFKVCVMRHIPIFTFINKMDRDARDTFELLDDIETVLGIKTCPVNWPIGSGKEFKGVYDRKTQVVSTFQAISTGGAKKAAETDYHIEDEGLKKLVGSYLYDQFKEEIELVDGATDEMDIEKVRAGELSPVFFGSALNTFVFKIQANMNKAHRDRIAFMRICSGKFEAGMEVYHAASKRKIKLSQPQQLMAQDRKIVEEAYAGDVIGVFDPDLFSIGDTLTAGGKKFEYEGIPTFAPEHFCRVVQLNSMKRKQFVKGVTQIAQEGAIQIFQEYTAGLSEIIVGVVGVLQFDVLKYRLENEYGCEIRLEPIPYNYIRWVKDPTTDVTKLKRVSDVKKVKDMKGNPLLLFANEWVIDQVLQHNEGLELEEFRKN